MGMCLNYEGGGMKDEVALPRRIATIHFILHPPSFILSGSPGFPWRDSHES
jgi:hypothetical protein